MLDQAQPDRSQGEEENGGNGQEHDHCPHQHGADVALADVGEQRCGAGTVDAAYMRRVVRQPRLGARVQLEHLPGIEGFRRYRHSRGGPGSVDLVVQVQALRKRELVEQQVLRRQLLTFRDSVGGRVVAVHASG